MIFRYFAMLAFWLSLLAPASADEFKPALLEIIQTAPERYAVTWKSPLPNGMRLPLQPEFEALEQVGPVSGRKVTGSLVEKTSWRGAPDALVGSEVGVLGLSALQLDVVVQVKLLDGTEHSAILRSVSPSWQVPEESTAWVVAGSYWKIGTMHILEGFDHLMFVLALILIVPGWWMLLKTITAFTLAHSITLALATLGVVNIPGPPTEAVIALSILFLAVEIVHSQDGRITLAERYPWLVALAFGLVHGLGFAGALSEVGLPEADIPLALLMFNVGVETGQLLFVGIVVVVRASLGRLVNWPVGSQRLVPYGIGGISGFWLIDRVAGFV